MGDAYPAEPSAHHDDVELVLAARSGNEQAFKELVERYQDLVCSVAYALTGNHIQSEDIAQETFLVAWRRLPEMQPPYRFRGWVCGIARLEVRRARKERRRKPAAAPLPP